VNRSSRAACHSSLETISGSAISFCAIDGDGIPGPSCFVMVSPTPAPWSKCPYSGRPADPGDLIADDARECADAVARHAADLADVVQIGDDDSAGGVLRAE